MRSLPTTRRVAPAHCKYGNEDSGQPKTNKNFKNRIIDIFQWIKTERGHEENVINVEVVNGKGEENGYRSMESKRVG